MFKKKFIFHKPPKNDVIIFDESHSQIIIQYMLYGMSPYIYKMRPEVIHISPSLVYLFIKSLRFINLMKVMSNEKKLKFMIRELLLHWRWSCFLYMNPKVVITAVDNDLIFHWLAKKHKSGRFFAIQNGQRLNIHLRTFVPIYLQHFFCFGNYDKDKYKRFGHTVLNHYPVGAFKLGIYEKHFKKKLEEDYDIGIISEFRAFLNEEQDNLSGISYTIKNAQFKMHNLLSKYIKELNRKVCIILSAENNKDEIKYFNNFYKGITNYIYNDRDKFTSYRAIDSCGLVIGFSSTLLSEAMGLKKKVLRIDFTESAEFNDYDPKIVLKNPTYEELEKRLNQLLKEPYDSYLERTKEYSSHVMNYKPDLPPHVQIRRKIEEYL